MTTAEKTFEVGQKIEGGSDDLRNIPAGSVVVSTKTLQQKTRSPHNTGSWFVGGGSGWEGPYVIVKVAEVPPKPAPKYTAAQLNQLPTLMDLVKRDARVVLLNYRFDAEAGTEGTVKDDGIDGDGEVLVRLDGADRNVYVSAGSLAFVPEGDRLADGNFSQGTKVKLVEAHWNHPVGDVGISDSNSIDDDGEVFVIFETGNNDYVHASKLVLA